MLSPASRCGFIRIQVTAFDNLLPGVVVHIRMAEQPTTAKLRLSSIGISRFASPTRFHHDITTGQQVVFQNGAIILKQLLIDRLIKGFAVFELVNPPPPAQTASYFRGSRCSAPHVR
jgi:hypothetical protein